MQTGEPLPESFTLDHDAVRAPYVRKAGEVTLRGGSRVVKWDVRFEQPNQGHLEMPVVHSVEHMLATTLRTVTDAVIDISPMGCQTGFYVSVDGEVLGGFTEFTEVLTAGLERALVLNEVPGATRLECGWAASHTLEGAQGAIREFLSEQSEWPHVFGTDQSHG